MQVLACAKIARRANIVEKVAMPLFHVMRAFTAEQVRASALHAQQAATVQLIQRRQYHVLGAAIAPSAKESVIRAQRGTRAPRVHFTRQRALLDTTVPRISQVVQFAMQDPTASKCLRRPFLVSQALTALQGRASAVCVLLDIIASVIQRYPQSVMQARTVTKVSPSVQRASKATTVRKAQ